MYLFKWKGQIVGKNKKVKTNRKGNYYNSKEYERLKAEITYEMIRQNKSPIITEDVIVRIIFTISRSRDIDSGLSLICDCLQLAKVIKNDNRIIQLKIDKEIKRHIEHYDEIFVSVRKVFNDGN